MKAKRLHSEDARLLRSMLYDILRRLDAIETAVGELQEQADPRHCEVIPLLAQSEGK